jgi:hypothetical protein
MVLHPELEGSRCLIRRSRESSIDERERESLASPYISSKGLGYRKIEGVLLVISSSVYTAPSGIPGRGNFRWSGENH